jgi:cytoskeletal protein RodZ
MRPDVDGHFGGYLKAARTARGLTLGDLSRATKIKESMLELVETARLEELPADVFVVGFIKAYAREVGADAAEALRRYRASRGGALAPAPALNDEEQPLTSDETEGPLHGRRFGVALVVFLILIVATLTLSLLLRHSSGGGALS